MNKRIMALGLLGLSLSMAVPVTNYAKEIETDKEIVTNIEGNEVLETSVTAEEYEAFVVITGHQEIQAGQLR